MRPPAPGWGDLWHAFGRIGLLSFGGPAAQIALMHRELVDERKWLGEEEYLRALSFCMLLPGPEAMQLATYAGWRLRGVSGGLLAGLMFVAPGASVILALAAAYVTWGGLAWVNALFFGIKACVAVIVIEALLRVARRALKGRVQWLIALLSFVAIFAFAVPFPVIILGAGLVGAAFLVRPGKADVAAAAPTHGHLLPTLVTGALLWALPLVAARAFGQTFLWSVGLFFSKLALVTFGGAYAVLAYMAQDVVQGHGWITTAAMMDALGLAETTPGPLILVTEFVAFLAGHAQGGFALALLAAALTLWVTFLPCFLWIFAFAPYLAYLTTRPRLAAALSAITAAVVGVIANLALWFALHVLFADVRLFVAEPLSLPLPELTSLVPGALLILVLSGIALLRLHWPLAGVLALSATLGLLLSAIG